MGRYELLFELARGGMGAIWVGCLHGAHGFGRFVALKALERGLLGHNDGAAGAADRDAEARAHFLEEAKVAARIHHPSVVQTLELFEHEGEPFIVMELVRGVSLARLLDLLAGKKQVVAPEIAAWITMLVASGLHAAHELRDRNGALLALVHRDVSPQNVLLSFEGRAYVADFGVAKFHRESLQTQSGVLKGKFGYMSPEQAQAQPLDRRSDIFSLGIVFYEMLTGARLYRANQPSEALVQIIHATPPNPRELRPDIPPELAAIATRCLQKAPEARYATADDLRAALRTVLQRIAATVDEQRLAELLRRWFPQEEEALNRRIERAVAVAAAAEEDKKEGNKEAEATTTGLAHALAPPNDELATERASRPPVVLEMESGQQRIEQPASPTTAMGSHVDDSVSVGVSVINGKARRRSRLVIVTFAVLLFVAAVTILWRARVDQSQRATAIPPAPPTVSGGAASPSAVASPMATESSTTTTAAAPDPSGSARATTTTTTTMRPRPVSSARSAPTPKIGTPQPPASTSSTSSKGVLFKDL